MESAGERHQGSCCRCWICICCWRVHRGGEDDERVWVLHQDLKDFNCTLSFLFIVLYSLAPVGCNRDDVSYGIWGMNLCFLCFI
jgi:hypothetical protein